MIIGRDDQVFPILVSAGIVGQVEECSGSEPAGVAGALCGLVVHMLLFHAYPSPVVALVAFQVPTRIVVDLEVRTGVLMGMMPPGQQLLPGCRIVEIRVGEGAGLDRAGDGPVVDVVTLPPCGRIGGVVGDFLVTGNGAVGTVAVGQDQGMFAVFVLEVVVDAFLFHEPADEVEVGLPVLHAVVPGAIQFAGQEFLEVGVAVLAEDFFEDVRDGFFLKNATVGGAGEKPEPGDEGSTVDGNRSVEAGV